MDTPGNTQLTDALHHVIAETEAILAALEGSDDAKLEALRQRVQETVETARVRLADIERTPEQPLERAMSAVESWVQENPWTTLAVCAGAGVLVGMLVGRRLRTALRAAATGPDAS